MCYTLQSNLLFVALANLEAPTFQVVYQSKTLFTALSSRLLIGRELKASQWFALLLLCLGTVLASRTMFWLSRIAGAARWTMPSNHRSRSCVVKPSVTPSQR